MYNLFRIGVIHRFSVSLFFCLVFIPGVAQVKVSGYVFGAEDQLPLYPVSVIIKGTPNGTLTDSTGHFTLETKKGSTLVFSFVGHNPVEIVAGADATLHITLTNTLASLDQVVMTGYMSQTVKEITGSVSVIKGSNLTTDPVGQVDEMMQGKASGLTVISSGEPGAASVVRINGIGNFGDVTPLYIIDGIQGDINALNPYDIETLQVLKDAGAYSIYGVRAANGVIVITTRKGKTGKSSISFDAYAGYEVPSNKTLNLLNPWGQASIYWTALKNSGLVDPGTGNPSDPVYGNGPVPVLPDYYLNFQGYSADAPEVNPDLYNITPGKPLHQIIPFNKYGTDWYHELFKPAWNQNYTVSVSGGNDKNHYLFSLGYLNQEGTYLETYFKKLTARVNTDFNIRNSFRMGENLQLNQNQSPFQSSPIYNSLITDPWLPVYDIKGNASSEAGYFAGPTGNPVAVQQLSTNNTNNNWQILGNAFAELDFLKHFTLRSSYGGSYNFYNSYNYEYGPYDTAVGLNKFTENTGYSTSWTWTNTLTFSNVFSGKHHLKVLIGTENINTYSRGSSGSSQGYFSDNPNLRFLGNGNGIPADQTVSSIATTTFLSSFISALEYGYNEKYFLSATLREDASSVFSAETRSGWFPSVGAAWRISQERFMTGIGWITDLKLRGSWGISGYNGNTLPLNQYTLYGGNPFISFYDIYGTSNSLLTGLTMTQIGNTKTGWQKDYMTDIGLESVLWNGKLSVTADWYNKESTGLLFPVLLPSILGFATSPNVNIGELQNTGVNITLGSKGNFSKNAGWNFSVAWTAYKTKVVRLNGVSYFDDQQTQYGPLVRNEIGYPIGSYYGYKIVGIFRNADDVAKSPVQEAAAPGRFKYLDANKDGTISDLDRVHLGNPNPKFTAGITIGFNFKQFDFSTFSYWSYGNDVLNLVRDNIDIYAGLFTQPKSVAALNDAWTPDHPDRKIPVIEAFQNFSNTGVNNSYPVESGSYFKNKSMIFGYSLPAGTLQKLRIDRLRIYFEVVNLFTITNYSGLDPELKGTSTSFGIDYISYPYGQQGNYPNNQRQYLLGINLNF